MKYNFLIPETTKPLEAHAAYFGLLVVLRGMAGRMKKGWGRGFLTSHGSTAEVRAAVITAESLALASGKGLSERHCNRVVRACWCFSMPPAQSAQGC